MNLPKVREIVMQLNGNGLLITRAPASLRNANLAADIVAIARCYGFLVTIIPRIENSSYTIREAFNGIMNLDFLEDPCQIKTYMLQCMSANEMKEIVAMERADISPVVFAMLQNAQPTTTSDEREFSLVGNVYTDDRPFQPQSVSAYMQLLYNSPSLTL